MATSTPLGSPRWGFRFGLRVLALSLCILLTSLPWLTSPAHAQLTRIACGYSVTTEVEYVQVNGSVQTIFTWTLVNTNPGNGNNGTFQDLSHWSQKLDVCVDPDDLVPDGYTYGPDNSINCPEVTGSVVKFDRGTSGTTPSVYSLALEGYYTPVLVYAAFKAGNETCCAQIWGVGCCVLEVTCPTNTSLGTFNCSNLNTIPAAPTTLAALSAPPYNITIGTNPCGTIKFSVASDAPAVNICAATNQTISRVITIWDDLNGNSTRDANEQYATCTFTYTIEVDDTPPSITCPPDVTVNCDESTDPADTGEATASDNCDQNLDITYTDATTPGNCPQEYTITRTWTATDNCGNTASCTQIISVEDVTPPSITCPPDVTVNSDESTDPADTGEATASDNCDQNLDITYTDATTPGNCPQEYTITRTWTATDNCGNTASCTQIISVEDDTPPSITCPANTTVECLADIPAEPANLAAFLALPGATASDNSSATLIYSVTTGSLVGGACGGTVTRTHTVTDACGNTASCNQVFTVDDNTAPTITQAEGADFTADCGVDPGPLFSAPVFADNCGTPTVTETNTQAPGPNNSVIYTRTWTATDACNNQTVVSQSITVPPCPIPPTGDEGCTPGYWKNHPEAWCDTYDPDQSFLSVFTGITNQTIIAHFTGVTLMEALALNGGGTNALARHAVAALLNACSVDYPYSSTDIIAAVVAVLNGGTATLPGITGQLNVTTLKDALDSANNLGCPLGNANTTASTTLGTPATGELSVLAAPNPFYNSIRFNFTAPQSGLANLEIYDLMGRKLAKVFEGQVEKGIQKTVDYRVPQAQRIPLIYRLTIGDKTSFGKLVPGSTD